MTKDDLITIVEHYVPKKEDRDSVLSAVWDYSEALIAAKPFVSGSLPSQELISMLKECRDLLVMCSLIDKSGHCKSLVDKVDTKMGWQ